MITQSLWRRVGAITIGLGSVMAVYAVVTDLLRDSILHLVPFFGVAAESGDVAPETSLMFVGIYWIVFLLLIGTALYCALLDLRFIRTQYAIEKREIFGRTIGDREFREALLKQVGEDSPPSAGNDDKA